MERRGRGSLLSFAQLSIQIQFESLFVASFQNVVRGDERGTDETIAGDGGRGDGGLVEGDGVGFFFRCRRRGDVPRDGGEGIHRFEEHVETEAAAFQIILVIVVSFE